MKSLKLVIISIVLLFFNSCCMNSNQNNVEEWKSEILQAESDFAEMAKQKGIKTAFLFFADEKAVLSRNNKLIEGKENIRKFFESQSSENKNVSLVWKPDFLDVSESGDIGYTYGKYKYSATDSNSEKIETEGVFHTVWKKQTDGSWKYVWD